jgi:hypothetical protein
LIQQQQLGMRNEIKPKNLHIAACLERIKAHVESKILKGHCIESLWFKRCENKTNENSPAIPDRCQGCKTVSIYQFMFIEVSEALITIIHPSITESQTFPCCIYSAAAARHAK